MSRNPGSRTHTRRLYAVLAVFGLVVTACSSGDGGDAEEDGDTASADSVESQNLGDDGDPEYGGELVSGLAALTEGGWCLPEAQLAASGIQVAQAIYDPLVRYNDELEAVPYLAKSFEPNETFDEWTVELRSGIKFHNGEDLDAEAVAMNIDAFRGVETFDLIPTLFPFVFKDISDVQVVDDLTVVIATSRPWVALPEYFASGRLGIAAPEQLRSGRETCANTPVGTGPFKAADTPWNLTGEIRVERYDDYWLRDSNEDPLPYLDAITFRAQPDSARRVENLQAGSGGFDMTHMNAAVDILEMDALAEGGAIRMVIEGDDFAEVDYVLLNTNPESDSPFTDPRLREAMARAVDREAVNDLVNEGLNAIAGGPFGPGVMGYVEDTGFPGFDPERAQELFDEIVAESGPIVIDLAHTPTPVTQQLADEIVFQLEEYDGVTVKETSALQSQLINQALTGDFDAILVRNHPGADPDTQYVWWYSSSPVNFGGIDDSEIDRLLDEGRSAPPDERPLIYEEVNRRLAEEIYNVWSWYSIWALGARTRVHGLTTQMLPNGDTAMPLFGGVGQLYGIWVDDGS